MSSAIGFHFPPAKPGSQSIFECIKNAIDSADEAVLAVAYIGEDACKEIGLDKGLIEKGKKLEIYCDLASGACNPDELRKMIDDLNIPVFSVSNMHAKVVWTPDHVIIGSANLSANGLGFEGKELKTNIEAGVRCEDKAICDDVRGWLDRLKSKRIDTSSPDFRSAEQAWRKRRRNRPIPGDRLSDLFNYPESLRGRDWYAYVTSGDFQPEGKKQDAKAKKNYGPEMSGWEFKGKKTRRGWYVDYWLDDKTKKLSFTGVWKLRPDIDPQPTAHGFFYHYAINTKNWLGDGDPDKAELDKEAKRRIKKYLNALIAANPELPDDDDWRGVPLFEIASSD